MDALAFIILFTGAFLGDDHVTVELGQASALSATDAAVAEPARWPGDTLRCRYNPEGAPLDLETVETAIVEAGRAWQLKSGLNFEYIGTTSELPGEVVYDCLISWDLFSSIFKLGQARNFRIAGEMVGTDIRISKLVNAERLPMVLKHEIGHGLGLKHDNEGCIMRTSPDASHLCFSDYAGISYLYPPFKVDDRPGMDCSVNLLPDNEVYIPSIDGRFWARYRLNPKDMSLSYIEHGTIEDDRFFLCK